MLVKTGSRLVKARFSRYRLDHPGVPLLFPVAVFLSAGLLFFVEPMFARMVLPKLGGAPAVWNTCVAFYQVLLLAGYAYAHIIARRLHIKTQIVVHLMLLLVAMVWLPVKVGVTWTQHSELSRTSLPKGFGAMTPMTRFFLRSSGCPCFGL